MSSELHRFQDNITESAGIEGALGRNATAHYSFACGELEGEYQVTALDAVEELSRPYHIKVGLQALDEATSMADLLGKDAQIRIERQAHHRWFCGVVSRVTVLDEGEVMESGTVEIVPALAALGLTRSTRIFQDKSALEIVEAVLQEALGPYRRTFDASALARESYLTRDYCVQYQETNLAFVHRLLEEEGIGYQFEYGEREQLILFDDSTRHARPVETMDGGPVRFDYHHRTIAEAEPVMRFHPAIQRTSTATAIHDHNWARAHPGVDAGVVAGPSAGPAHEVYEHGFGHHVTIREEAEGLATAVQLALSVALPDGLPRGIAGAAIDLFGCSFGDFTTNNAAFQGEIRQQLRVRDRQRASGLGVVTGFRPGCSFELIGHPTLGADGSYLLTRVRHKGGATLESPSEAGDGDDYRNEFECVPAHVRWRPERSTRKPRIYGLQTARVTGPLGLEVYTDQYGRIKVKFNWDRSADDLGGNDSCWIRVSQIWAGEGYPGAMFTPRVGMEVVVSFIDGDPDRPLVIGCVHNGKNHTPDLMPIRATKSMIRTRTVPLGPGYNELSFEDAMGMERVHIRAQRDMDVLVLQDQETTTQRDQYNTVCRDQFERVMGDQVVTIGGSREHLVSASEYETTHGDHSRSVGRNATLSVTDHYRITVEDGAMVTSVANGEYVVESRGRLVLAQNGENGISMTADGNGKGWW